MPNKKNIEEVERLSKSLSKAKAIYFTEYHGLNVGDLTKLRSQFFKADVEFKVAKGNKLRFSPLQISYHVAHPHNSFILAEALGSSTVKLYEGSVIQELDACGLKLDPLCVGLDACSLYLSKLGA